MVRLPRTRQEIPTPALLVDLDQLERNLRRLSTHCRENGIQFRPHAKTHKCPALARRQLDSGAIGISVATVSEAEVMVEAGISGVLLTSPLADPAKVERLVSLVKGGAELLVAAGHALEVELLTTAAAQLPRGSLQLLIDLDVGDRRSGVPPGPPALELARRIAEHRVMRLRGVQAYAGHASHVVGFDERLRASRIAVEQAVETKDLLRSSGFEADILSCGSTGTYNIDSGIPGVTELQCGSYVFMDLDYRRIGGRPDAVRYEDFESSLRVLTMVVSTTHADRVSIDAGIKALSTDTPFTAEVVGRPELTYARTGDEFGSLRLPGSGKLPQLGERLDLYPPHCDPTVHLYDRIYAMRGEQVEAIWPIRARREHDALTTDFEK